MGFLETASLVGHNCFYSLYLRVVCILRRARQTFYSAHDFVSGRALYAKKLFSDTFSILPEIMPFV